MVSCIWLLVVLLLLYRKTGHLVKIYSSYSPSIYSTVFVIVFYPNKFSERNETMFIISSCFCSAHYFPFLWICNMLFSLYSCWLGILFFWKTMPLTLFFLFMKTQLWHLAQRTTSLPLGRGAFTLATIHTLLTEVLFIFNFLVLFLFSLWDFILFLIKTKYTVSDVIFFKTLGF